MTVRGILGSEKLALPANDPRERKDVFADRPEVVARLRQMASDYLQLQPTWNEAAPNLEMDEMQLNQLRALGYKIP